MQLGKDKASIRRIFHEHAGPSRGPGVLKFLNHFGLHNQGVICLLPLDSFETFPRLAFLLSRMV